MFDERNFNNFGCVDLYNMYSTWCKFVLIRSFSLFIYIILCGLVGEGISKL